MTLEDCFLLGYITKTHGIHGELTIKLDVDDPSRYNKMESVLVNENNTPVPFFIESWTHSTDKVIVAFEGIETLDEAHQMVGKSLHLPLSALPELPEDQFYFHEIIGYEVIDRNHGNLGKVEAINDSTSQILIEINYEGQDVLIPLVDEIAQVDKGKHQITTYLPEGYLDIYK